MSVFKLTGEGMACWVIRSSSSLETKTNASKGGQHPHPCNRALRFPPLFVPFKIPALEYMSESLQSLKVEHLFPRVAKPFSLAGVTAAGNPLVL